MSDAIATAGRWTLATTEGGTRLPERASVEILAEAYHRAAMLGLDMRAVTAGLEELREQSAPSTDPYRFWGALVAAVTSTTSDDHRRLLLDVLDVYVSRLLSSLRGAVDDLGRLGPSAWIDWLRLYAEAFGAWQFGVCAELLEGRPTAPPEESEADRILAGQTTLLPQGRWVEVTELLDLLSRHPAVAHEHRASALCRLGQVNLYLTGRTTEAEDQMQAAIALDQENGEAYYALGRLRLQADRGAQARTCQKRAIDLGSGVDQAYEGMGEVAEWAGDLTGAERWYRDAATRSRGPAPTGVVNLVRLLGRPELYPDRHPDIDDAVELSCLFGPMATHEINCVAAEQHRCQADDHTAAALTCADRAIAARPDWPRGHLERALVIAVAEGSSPDVEEIFAAAPGFADGYSMVVTHHERGAHAANDEHGALAHWREALRWCERGRAHGGPGAALFAAWAGLIRVQRLPTEPGIVDELLAELNRYRDHDCARMPLHALAQTFVAADEHDRAGVIYQQVRERSPSSYLPTYLNLRGNLAFDQERWADSAADYEASLVGDPDNPVVHRNLAGAYRALERFTDAIEHIETAYRLDGRADERDPELAQTSNAEANIKYGIGDFVGSVPLYEQAVAGDPRNAVYQENLSNALINGAQPGARLPALRQAAAALRHADDIDGTPERHARYLRTIDLVHGGKRFGEDALGSLLDQRRVVVEVAPDLVEHVADADYALLDEVAEHLAGLRRDLVERDGVYLPTVTFRDRSISSGHFVASVAGRSVVAGSVPVGHRFVAHALREGGPVVLDPLIGVPGAWVRAVDGTEHRIGPVPFVLRAVVATLLLRPDMLLSHETVVALIAASPVATGRLGGFAPVRLACAVLRGLLSERVPITDLDPIFDAVLAGLDAGQPPATIIELVRALPEIRDRLPGLQDGSVSLVLPDRVLALLARATVRSPAGPVLALPPAQQEAVVGALRAQVAGLDAIARVRVDRPELRPLARMLLRPAFPALPVLSAAEVSTAPQDRLLHVELPSESER